MSRPTTYTRLAVRTERSARIGRRARTLRLVVDEVCDTTYYSKAWHRQYGPKVTITGQRVEVLRTTKTGERVVEQTIPVTRADERTFARIARELGATFA